LGLSRARSRTIKSQNYTIYAGGIGAAAQQPEAAEKLLRLFSSENARRVLRDKGMEPPNG
jgi:molybdate transport system substrate-binding protein